MAKLSQIKLGNDTYDIAAHGLKYAPILDTQEKLDGFIEANTFKTGYWNSFTPTGLITNGLILSGGWTSTSYGFQIAIDDDPTWKMWLRQKNGNGWQDWKQIPMGDGTGASGTWGINITGSAGSANSVAWENVSGKPTEFTPSSHTHSYLPLSGGTLTGTVNSSGNMNLYGSNAYFSLGTSSSSSKCYFQTYNATTAGADDANLKAGFGFGWSNSLVVDKSGNVTIPGDLTVSGGDIAGKASSAKVADAVAWNNITGKPSSFPPAAHNHDSTYLKLSGGTLTGLLNAHGGISLNSSTAQASGAPEFILGIKAFAEGGNVIWQSRANVSVGYADSAGTCTSLSTNAGSATKAIYFSGGKPVQCNDTINHNISGTAAAANKVNNIRTIGSSAMNHAQSLSAEFEANKSTLPRNQLLTYYSSALGNGSFYQGYFLSGYDTTPYGGFYVCHYNTPYYVGISYGSFNQYQLWKSGDAVTGAVWNDYAECRESDCEEFGYVLMETGNDSLTKTVERLSHFAGISSDTWGFSQGETEKAKTHIAVAGRVLAYPYQDRNNYKPGDCVCAAPGGTVDIMTREEVINWPDRIVGTVSSVPDYEEWGGGNDREPVKVNGRIWIKVK